MATSLMSTAVQEASESQSDKAQIKKDFLEACERACDDIVGGKEGPFGESLKEIEEAIYDRVRFLGSLLIEKLLMGDELSKEGEFICPKCESVMRVQEAKKARRLSTALGDVEFQRPYCVCDRCKFCCAPLDYALGIPTRGPSVYRRELICEAATKDLSFERAQSTLACHGKIGISDEAIRKLAESEGRRIKEDCAKSVAECFRSLGRGLHVTEGSPRLLVVSCDGGSVQTRDKAERWKESKVGCVYDAQPDPNRDALTADKYRGAIAKTKTYVATMRPWTELGRMLFTEACRRGYLEAEEKVFISDAANGIINLRQEHFPDARLIIDWYHGVEHLYDCARAAFGAGTDEGMEWAELQKDKWSGKVEDVIEAVRTESERVGSPPSGAPDTDRRVILHRNVGYFSSNRNEMDYPEYRRRGWPIGSGVVESGVKQFSARVKGTEKFWNLSGADEMLALCALHYSEDGRWEEYWKKRGTPPEDAESFRASRPRTTGSRLYQSP